MLAAISFQILLKIHWMARRGILSGIFLRRIRKSVIATTKISRHTRVLDLNQPMNFPILEFAKDLELKFDILSLGTIVLPRVDRAPELKQLSAFLKLFGVITGSGI